MVCCQNSKPKKNSTQIFLLTFDLDFNAFTHKASADYFVVTTLQSILQSGD